LVQNRLNIIQEAKYMQRIKLLIVAGYLTACQVPGESPPGTPETPGQSQHNNLALGSQPNQQNLIQATATPEPEFSTPMPSSTTPEPQPRPTPSEEPNPTASPAPGDLIFLDGNPTNLHPDNIAFIAPSPWPTEVPVVPVSGFVYDDHGNQHIDGVTVKIQSHLQEHAVEEEVAVDHIGYYRFWVPCGKQYLLTASKTGFHSRTQGQVIKCNDLALIRNMNQFDFGGPYGNITEALTKKPFVKALSTPVLIFKNSEQLEFTLDFTNEMEKTSVENALDTFLHKNLKLTADKSSSNYTFTEQSVYSTVSNSNQFIFSWLNESKTLNIKLKPDHPIFYDKNQDIQFRLTFSSPITSMNGYTRESHFFEYAYALVPSRFFTAQKDNQPPKLNSLNFSPAQLKLSFDKRLYITTPELTIAGGMGDRVGTPGSEIYAPAEYPGHQGNASGRNVAANYTVSITPPDASQPRLSTTWKALGGTVVYDPDDAQRRSVLLQAPVNTQATRQLFAAHSPVLSTALNQPLASQANSSWVMSYQLVQRNGGLSQVFTTSELGAEALNATAFASKLQTTLNTLQPQRWQVELDNSQQALRLRYADPTGETLGWQAQGISFNGNGNLPASWATSPVSWPAQSPFAWFSSAERIKVEAAATIMDPAGNTLDPAARNVEGFVP